MSQQPTFQPGKVVTTTVVPYKGRTLHVVDVLPTEGHHSGTVHYQLRDENGLDLIVLPETVLQPAE